MMLNSLLVGLRGQAAMQAEIIALRHQLTVLQRSQKSRRPMLTRVDRCLWVWLSQLWSAWRSALIIVKPETVIGWHRQGFQLYWTWKVRHGRSGRPQVPKQTRDLIRTMTVRTLFGVGLGSTVNCSNSELRSRRLLLPNIWSAIRSHHLKRGERSSTITYRNWLRLTSSPCTACGLKFCLSSLCSSMNAGVCFTST